jgi:hypothetical protein
MKALFRLFREIFHRDLVIKMNEPQSELCAISGKLTGLYDSGGGGYSVLTRKRPPRAINHHITVSYSVLFSITNPKIRIRSKSRPVFPSNGEEFTARAKTCQAVLAKKRAKKE